ncbi:MAG: PP2C family protein-serine/threonine phosphatase [Spirochaetota bacterium]
MRWSVFVLSDTGSVRRRNEDAAVVGTRIFRNESMGWEEDFGTVPRAIAAGVADGVGGAAAGDVASRLCLEHFVADLNAYDGGLSDADLRARLQRSAVDLHNEVTRQSMLHSERNGMATTLSSFVWYEGALYMVHAGDSRLYLYRSRTLSRLTRDHTLREFTGNVKIPGNILVNCIGVERDFFVDVARLESVGLPGDVLLACTDGLTDTVPERDISDILDGGNDPGTAGSELMSRANAAGAPDNVTFVLITVA